MAEPSGIANIVEQLVSQVLEGEVPRLRQVLVQRILAEAAPRMTASGAANASSPDALLKVISAVYGASTQRDILKALLDNGAQFCRRIALFVVKAGTVAGWQARGFEDNESVKDFVLDSNSELVSHVLQRHTPVAGHASKLEPKFVGRFGAPAEDHCILLPLLMRDKVAALLYADAGPEKGGNLELPSLELLVLSTGTWLEVVSLRKAAPKETEPVAAAKVEAPVARAAAAAHSGPSFHDPFASHAPSHVKPAVPPTIPEASDGRSDSGNSNAPFAGMSPDEAETHKKAQRFARLLVDEIKLYNQAKMMEGRKKKDIYDRLKEDIEKSRLTFQKRYGATVAASADYFSQEVIRSLAEDDVSLLGPNFKR
jgi:hypothetical protein